MLDEWSPEVCTSVKVRERLEENNQKVSEDGGLGAFIKAVEVVELQLLEGSSELAVQVSAAFQKMGSVREGML